MQYSVRLQWQNSTGELNPKTFDRSHTVKFNGGVEIKNTAAPEFSGDAALPNPEELFTASIASCFMLTFLVLSANKGIVVEDYSDEPVGLLGKNSEGKMAMTEVTLRPAVKFKDDKKPDDATLQQLFEKSHHYCFISSSVKTTIKVEPR